MQVSSFSFVVPLLCYAESSSVCVRALRENVNVRKSQSDGISRRCTDFLTGKRLRRMACIYGTVERETPSISGKTTSPPPPSSTKKKKRERESKLMYKGRMPDMSRSVPTLFSLVPTLLTQEHDKVLIEIHWQ